MVILGLVKENQEFARIKNATRLIGIKQKENKMYVENKKLFKINRKKLLTKYTSCGCCKETNYPLCVDHIIPKTDMRCTDEISNLQVICNSCNSSKGNREIIKYDRQKKYKVIRGPRKRKIKKETYLLKCSKCKQEWNAWTDHPVQCSRCKSPFWNKPRKNKKREAK